MSGDNIKVEAASEERTDVQAARAAPVSLPAGSYDSEALNAALSEAAKAKNDDNRQELVDKAVEKANETALPVDTLGVPPGYKRVEVDVPELGVTETRTVYDPSRKDEAEASQTGTPAPIQPAANDASANTASKGE